MVHDGLNWRMKKRRRALILSAALLPLLAFAASAVHAQSIMRTPNLNVGSRVPSINTTARPNVSINTVARTTPQIGVRSTLSVARFSNLNPGCQAASRGPAGECSDSPVASAGGGKGGSAKSAAKKGKGGGDKGNSQAAANLRTVPERTRRGNRRDAVHDRSR